MTGMYMYDSIDPTQIREDAEIVAGYVNGPISQWPADAWNKWPNARMVRITVDPTDYDADMYDCEPGNRSPDPNVWPVEAAGWCHIVMGPKGRIPVVYCDRNDHPILMANCPIGTKYVVAVPHSEPTEYINPDTGEVDPDVIGVQFAFSTDTAYTYGKNVDVTYVYGAPLLPELPPPPPPLPAVPPFPGYAVYGEGLLPNPPSDAVRQFQQRLFEVGYWCGGVDGRDGPETTNCIKTFQQNAGIKTDGVGGPITWAHLWG